MGSVEELVDHLLVFSQLAMEELDHGLDHVGQVVLYTALLLLKECIQMVYQAQLLLLVIVMELAIAVHSQMLTQMVMMKDLHERVD